ncbi:uncharacterized protein LOC121404585 [Drosophila obscura]|uniref:uncharacterized protein LOC121404585 n=1 Tax=Drosophila obscura TaxID=7282 RepID=UPI001BB14A56|nr:uncharacterized protein LOC121404585 [Drosophila obscura]
MLLMKTVSSKWLRIDSVLCNWLPDQSHPNAPRAFAQFDNPKTQYFVDFRKQQLLHSRGHRVKAFLHGYGSLDEAYFVPFNVVLPSPCLSKHRNLSFPWSNRICCASSRSRPTICGAYPNCRQKSTHR